MSDRKSIVILGIFAADTAYKAKRMVSSLLVAAVPALSSVAFQV